MKSKTCPQCRALLVQATTVCATCGYRFDDVQGHAVPRPTWASGEVAAPAPDAPGPVDGPPPSPPGSAEGAPFAEPGAEPGGGQGAPGFAAPGYGAPGYGAPGYGPVVRQNHPKATTALVLGILGLVVCGPLGIAAIVIGNNVRRDIRQWPGRYEGEGLAKAGVIMGWLAVAFLVLSVVMVVVLLSSGSGFEDPGQVEPRFE